MHVRHDASVLVEVVEWPHAKARPSHLLKVLDPRLPRPFHPAVVAATADADARLLGAEDSTSVRIELVEFAALPCPKSPSRHRRRRAVICSGAAKRAVKAAPAARPPSTSARRLTRGGERTTLQICTIASIGAATTAAAGRRPAIVHTSRFTPLHAAISFVRDRLTEARCASSSHHGAIGDSLLLFLTTPASAVVSQSLEQPTRRRGPPSSTTRSLSSSARRASAAPGRRLMEDRYVVLDGVQAACASRAAAGGCHPPAGLRRAQRLRRPASISCLRLSRSGGWTNTSPGRRRWRRRQVDRVDHEAWAAAQAAAGEPATPCLP